MRVDYTPEGVHLPEIGLWLDPAADCAAAWISHGHSDHARGLHRRAIATPETLAVYAMRFPDAADQELIPLALGETIEYRGARLTAHPAGHILGAAQLLIELGGERTLYTGDLKRRPPLLGAESATPQCDRLIIESTFGLPIFHLLSREEGRERILGFARECAEEGATPVYLCHPLGRGQEVLHTLCAAGLPAAVHGSVARFVPLYEKAGYEFPGWEAYRGLAADGKPLVVVHGFRRQVEASGKDFRVAYVSGWAALDNARARSGAEELIPYSDHADFEELLALVEAAAPREIDVVHGYAEPLARILAGRGWKATPRASSLARAGAIREADE